MTFKIAFIGSHGVGKTTLAYGLAARLKRRDLALEVVVEVVRRCPMPVNEQTTREAQHWILHSQIADELVAESRNEVVICDRSVLDNYVYLLVAQGGRPTLNALVDEWLGTYDLLVLVPTPENALSDDGFRSTNPQFQSLVDQRLRQELATRQVPFLELRSDQREFWLDLTEAVAVDRLEPPQLKLPT